MRLPRSVLIGGMAALAVVVIGAIALLDRSRANPSVVGLVRHTEIRIAPEVTGRLSALAVMTGQAVHKGGLLATLSNPELEASLGEAKAAWASAKADRDNVYAGVRAEEVAILARSIETAEANLLFAKQEDVRAVALAARDYASRQQLDESASQLAKSVADLDLKRAQHAAASAGPTAEERALADARVALAQATVADLQAQLDKTRLVAPADGVVGVIVAEQGEVVPVGKPVLMLDSDKPWFAFILREDDLGPLTVGSNVDLTMTGGRHISARVTELRPLGEFATWRAARAVGDHDLNSFRLRLDPVAPMDGLERGMSVWLTTNPRTVR
jgi:multidrug resistance efflux pump